MRFTVTNTFAVAELGTVAFVGFEPIALAFGSRHRVLITRPDGESLEAVASVEAVRRDSLACEFPALLFESLEVGEVVLGSSIFVLGEVTLAPTGTISKSSATNPRSSLTNEQD